MHVDESKENLFFFMYKKVLYFLVGSWKCFPFTYMGM